MRIRNDNEQVVVTAESQYEKDRLGDLFLAVVSWCPNAAKVLQGTTNFPIEYIHERGVLREAYYAAPTCEAEVVAFYKNGAIYLQSDPGTFINGVCCE